MSAGNLKIFGFPDIATTPSLTYTAGSEASADFPADNLRTEATSDTWRSAGYGFLATDIFVESLYEGGYHQYHVGGLGIVNHNLWPWTGDVRFIVGEGFTPPALTDLFQILTPTSMSDLVNTSGSVVADVQPGGGGTTASSLALSSWGFRVQFGLPTSAPAVGYGKNAFYVETRLTLGNSLTPSEAPNISAELWQNGVQMAVLETKAVCLDDIYFLIFRWDAADLADPTGADVELKLTATINATPTPERYPLIKEIQWVTENGTTGPGVLYDSGWVPAGAYVGNPNESSSKYLPLELTLGDSVAVDVSEQGIASEVGLANYVRVLLRDDHSPDKSIYNVVSFPSVPPNYVEAAHVVISGPVFSPEFNFAPGAMDGIRSLDVTKFTQSGGQYGSRSGTLRTAQLELVALTKAEKAFINDRILRRRGTTQPALVMLDSTSTLERESLTFYATISQPETVAASQLIPDYPRRLTLNLVEFR